MIQQVFEDKILSRRPVFEWLLVTLWPPNSEVVSRICKKYGTLSSVFLS
jgi:hypothetical protein